jgi:hypothetical protein
LPQPSSVLTQARAHFTPSLRDGAGRSGIADLNKIRWLRGEASIARDRDLISGNVIVHDRTKADLRAIADRYCTANSGVRRDDDVVPQSW